MEEAAKVRQIYEELVLKKQPETLVQIGAPLPRPNGNGNGNGHAREASEARQEAVVTN